MREGHRGRGAKEVIKHGSRILFDCGPLLAFQVTTDRRCAEMERAGSTDPALDHRVPRGAFFVPFRLEFPYFFLQTHFSDGWLQPTHTPLLISLPQVLHGSHPMVWHMVPSFQGTFIHVCPPFLPRPGCDRRPVFLGRSSSGPTVPTLPGPTPVISTIRARRPAPGHRRPRLRMNSLPT